MVIVRLRGGLGNQLFQYSTARAVAIRQHGRLRLDCSYFAGKKKRQFGLEALEIQAAVCSPVELALRRAWWRTVPALAPRVWRETSGFDPALLDIQEDVVLEGYFTNDKYFRHIRQELRAELQPRLPLDGRFATLVDRLRMPSSVSVHVRRGDYQSSLHNRTNFGLLIPAYYGAAAHAIRARVMSPRFFVFSDEPASAARDVLPVLGPDAETVPPAAQHDHFALMRLCRHHIVANSSFSWWAAWLADALPGMVVAPRPWFRRDSPREIVPSQWQTVDAGFEEP